MEKNETNETFTYQEEDELIKDFFRKISMSPAIGPRA